MQAALRALKDGNTAAAIQHFATARRFLPTDAGLLHSLAILYRQERRWAESWSAAETGLRLQPDSADCGAARAAALGCLLLDQGAASEALFWLRQALAAQPEWPEILSQAAEAAYRSGEMTSARSYLDRAVALEPDNRTLRMARATILLSQQIWMPGLQDYEYRLRPTPGLEVLRDGLHSPRWQGEDMAGRCLLVVAEQGIGDQIRFAGDLRDLVSLCGRLIVECESRLVPLLARSLPAITVAPSRQRRNGNRYVFDYGWLAELGPVDAWIEIGSLALRLFERNLPPDRLRR
ncbi:tetratricopeptide repeat protein [Ferrovibrio sp.]|uniref:tetratricopeptide repeat protein n=1 Tax=Ferrovibrio sp. TaxID=1917215 RepID=UPI003918A6D1